MRAHNAAVTATTNAPLDFVDVTDEVRAALLESGIRNGHVTVFAGDDRCTLVLNEHESGLWRDLRAVLARLDKHDVCDRRACLGSSSLVVPAVDGRLHLGTWQRFMLLELGTPSVRTVSVQIVGE